jgi:drug/metabolite transporter (DMT)-like permease
VDDAPYPVVKNLLPILMAVSGGVVYHVAQKSVPKQVSPFAAIMMAYAIGILCCLVAIVFVPRERPLLESWQGANWAVWMIGISATVIEISILLAYRAGWNISITSVVVNISVALVLLPIGLLIFREHISWPNAVGVACCLFGLYLLSR